MEEHEAEEFIEMSRARGLSDYDVAYQLFSAQADAQMMGDAHGVALMLPWLVELGLDEGDCEDALNEAVDDAGLASTW